MKEGIQKIIKNGENETTEFKKSFSDETIISLTAVAISDYRTKGNSD